MNLTRKERRKSQLEQRKMFREAYAAGVKHEAYFSGAINALPLKERLYKALDLVRGKM